MLYHTGKESKKEASLELGREQVQEERKGKKGIKRAREDPSTCNLSGTDHALTHSLIFSMI